MLRLIYIYYGTLLPGWTTLRAFSHGQKHFVVLWLKYWVIYAMLQGIGVLTDFLVGGLPFYGALKLILSICIWFSAPYSTNHLYDFIGYSVLGRMGPIIAYCNCYYHILRQKLVHILMQSALVTTIIGKDQDEQSKGPQVNGHLLKRELSCLLADIEMDKADQARRAADLDSLDRESMDYIINYLSQRQKDNQSGDMKPSPPYRWRMRYNATRHSE